ncbi:MAG: phosphatidylserine/phosphatidylglycerophosphate/cardiolipin synthase family protein [Paenibacillus sp.]|nr:phosphatidylserine/phosphatidylglycerophosphate/cardiolipin synthase family protein [Paenibacillus sp.]
MDNNQHTFSNLEESLQRSIIDLMNYHLSGGALQMMAEEAGDIAPVIKAGLYGLESRKYRQELGGIFTNLEQLMNIPGMNNDVMKELAGVASRLDQAKLKALAPQTSWNNEVTPYVNGPKCLEMLIDEIRKAERYIHLSMMLFFNDHSGNLITQELLAALNRGVKVRMMVNATITALGYEKNLTFGKFSELSDKLTAAGAQIRNTFESYYSADKWEAMRQELKLQGVPESVLFLQDSVQQDVEITGLNVIDHRKFIIIDGITSIIGSLNIGDQYTYETPIDASSTGPVSGHGLGIPAKEEEWHDGCFRIRGAVAKTLNVVFHSRWLLLGGELFNVEDSYYSPDTDLHFGEEECTVFVSFPGNQVNLIQQYYLDLITYACDETIIINPYLIDQDFWDRLQDVGPECSSHLTLCNSLLVNDHPTNRAAVRGNMYTPFCEGVSFYDYSGTGRFSHWKISYDKRSNAVFHGSYNINERSACHDFELGLLVKGQAFADKVKELIDYDLSVSRKVTDKNEFFKYPWLHPSTYLNAATRNYT